jgi:predicted nucleotidyltransferase component of viral defense system
MDETFYRKYKGVLEVLPDVAECAQGKLILVGGTALALFHLRHRISIDLDFVPAEGDEVEMKRMLKGCLSRKGYRTAAAAYSNQFVIQFEDTSIKVEVFSPERKVRVFEERNVGRAKIKVASLEGLLQLKMDSYANRREARDLFDIWSIMKGRGTKTSAVRKIIRKSGAPRNMEQLECIVVDGGKYELFRKDVETASGAGG